MEAEDGRSTGAFTVDSSTCSGRCGSPRSAAPRRRLRLDCDRGGLAPATIALILAVLHALFKTAVREELIDSNPATAVERPKILPRRWRILQPDEVGGWRRRSPTSRRAAVFMTLILTGVRRSELQGLRWRGRRPARGRAPGAAVEVGGGRASIALSPTLRDVLSEHYRTHRVQVRRRARVLPSDTREPVHGGGLR